MTKKIIKKKKSSVKFKKQKGLSVSKKDFETFKFGVERLKELGEELKSLDTRGFFKEEQEIKARLKKVSEIPVIEKKLRDLKLKINNKFKPKSKKKNPNKEIKKGLEEIQEDLESIKSKRTYKPSLSKPELNKIREELKKIRREYKEEIKSHKPDLEKIQEELKKIEKAHQKDSEIIKKSAKQKVHIDSGVDTLVDTNFNNFLKDTKKALSNRIEKKEKEIDEFMRIDLESREAKYNEKHENLLTDFEKKDKKLKEDSQKKFDEQVKNNLQKKISEEFREKLNRKFEEEKVRIDKEYKTELRRHAIEELENQKNKLEEKMSKKGKMLENKEKEELEKIKIKLVEESHKNLELELAKKEKALRIRLENEYTLEMKRKLQQHEEELKARKLNLELEMQKKIKQVLA